MSGTTKDDSERTLLRTRKQVKKISTEIYVELGVEELRNRTGGMEMLLTITAHDLPDGKECERFGCFPLRACVLSDY